MCHSLLLLLLPQVYVLGSKTVVAKRPSVGEQHLGPEAQKQGILQLPRISCKAPLGMDQLLPTPSGAVPPDWVTHRLASILRQRLGLHLFNFDLIRPEGQAAQYYVVDINYFPGVDKIPNFEAVFVDFLKATLDPSLAATAGGRPGARALLTGY